MIKLRLAFRNIMRNRRRTLLNLSMIASGLTAIVISRGLAHNLIDKVEEAAINTQYGHLQFASQKFWEGSPKDRLVTKLIEPEAALIEKVKAVPGVENVSGRLSFYGLISSPEGSLSARGVGFSPEQEKPMNESLLIIEGRPLPAGSKFEVIVGSGLNQQLGAKVGDSLTLMGYTVDGSVNAIDSELVGIFQTKVTEVDNSTFFISLPTAQRLLTTDAVERMVVRIHETPKTDETRAQIQALLPENLVARTWTELATFYQQVVDYYKIQNLMVEVVIMLLVLLSIANTVGMAISERTGEIGTVRALGDTRADLVWQFMLEGLILGLLGGALGCVMGLVVTNSVNAMEIMVQVPGASAPVAIDIAPLFTSFRDGVMLTTAMAVVASVVPAVRASRMKIVEALKRNI